MNVFDEGEAAFGIDTDIVEEMRRNVRQSRHGLFKVFRATSPIHPNRGKSVPDQIDDPRPKADTGLVRRHFCGDQIVVEVSAPVPAVDGFDEGLYAKSVVHVVDLPIKCRLLARDEPTIAKPANRAVPQGTRDLTCTTCGGRLPSRDKAGRPGRPGLGLGTMLGAGRKPQPGIGRALVGFPLFKDLDADTLDRLAAIGHVRTWTEGTYLFQRDDDGDHMIAVTAGRIRLSIGTPHGRELVICHLLPGDVLGELALIDAGHGLLMPLL